jgi:hypothetical protein
MPSESFDVKGLAIITCRDWIDARFAPGHFMAFAREKDSKFPERVLPSDWYPVRPVVHALQRSAAELDEFDGFESFVTMLAGESAKQDLRGIYRAFLWVASPRMFLRAAPKIWASYANFAVVSDIENEPNRFQACIREIPRDLVDWLAGSWKGFLPPAIELAGGKNPRAAVLERKPSGSGNWEIQYQLTYE